VANVRLPLAELIVIELMPREHYASQPVVQEMLTQLRADADRDVLRTVHAEGFEPPPYRSKEKPLTLGSPSAVIQEPARHMGHTDDDDDEASMPRKFLGPEEAVAGTDLRPTSSPSGSGMVEVRDGSREPPEELTRRAVKADNRS